MVYNKFGKDWPSSSWEEDVNGRHDRRRAPIHNNKSPVWPTEHTQKQNSTNRNVVNIPGGICCSPL